MEKNTPNIHNNINQTILDLSQQLLEYKKQYNNADTTEIKDLEDEVYRLQNEYTVNSAKLKEAREINERQSSVSFWPKKLWYKFTNLTNYMMGKKNASEIIDECVKKEAELSSAITQMNTRIQELKEIRETMRQNILDTEKKLEELQKIKADEKAKNDIKTKEFLEEQKKNLINDVKKEQEAVNTMKREAILPTTNERTTKNKNQSELYAPKISYTAQPTMQHMSHPVDIPVSKPMNDGEWLFEQLQGFMPYDEFKKICDFCNFEEIKQINNKQDIVELIGILKDYNIADFQSFHNMIVEDMNKILQDNNMLLENDNEIEPQQFNNFNDYVNFLHQNFKNQNEYDKFLVKMLDNNNDQNIKRAETKINELTDKQNKLNFFEKILSLFFDYKSIRSDIEKAREEYKKAVRKRTKDKQNMLRRTGYKSDIYEEKLLEASQEHLRRNIQFANVYDGYEEHENSNSIANNGLANNQIYQRGNMF